MSIAKYATRNAKPMLTSGPALREPDVIADAVDLLIGVAAGLVRLVLRAPGHSGAALVLLAGFLRFGLLGPASVLAATVVILAAWFGVHPGSFRAQVSARVRSMWRRWWVYARQWQPVLLAHGLAVHRGQEVPMVPELLPRARSDAWSDRLRVDLMPGLGPEDMQREASNLAHAFGARTCTVAVLKPGRVELTFKTGDPLAAPLPALPIPAKADLAAVSVGRREDGQPWTLPATGTHVLIAGATGSGKGSVLWSLLRGLAPEITAGRVQAWGIDPKGGMELAFGRAMFTRLADTTVEDMADLLDDAVAVMNTRTARLAGHSRLHEPTPDEPLLLLVLDELASLTAYVANRELRRRIDVALQQLLTKGRAAGVCVVGALQDPRKEVLGYRDLFPARVALRLVEREQVGMVLGDAAWELGAHCERIPHGLPGVGFVYLDGQREPVRVRAGHVTDDDIREMAKQYPAPPSALLLPAAAPEVVDIRGTSSRLKTPAAAA